MAENRLGIGHIAFPQTIDTDTLLALEEFNRKIDDNINYLLRPKLTTVSSDYSVLDVDRTVVVTASSTITLPEARVNINKMITVKHNKFGGTVTVVGFAGELIDGLASYSLNATNSYATFHCDGTNWHVI